MPRSGSGQYVLPAGNPVVPNTDIEAAWANTTLNDIAQALTDSIAADGQTAAAANLPMGGFRHTTVGKATALTQYTRADQTQTGELVVLVTVLMAVPDAYTATLPLAATTFIQNQIVFMRAPASNAGASTLNINAAGAKAILHADGTPTVLGDIVSGVLYGLAWDGNAWRFLNASSDYTALDARYLRLTGGSMTGPLAVLTPVGNNDAAPKIYVDNSLAGKLNLSGGIMTGSLTLAADPAAPFQAATAQWVQAQIAGATAGVSSFNTRQGAVTLLASDVNNAYGFVPYNSANPAGYITTISGAQVVTALGYTPYSAAGGTVSGSVTATGSVTAKQHTQTVLSQNVTGATNLDYSAGQSQVWTLTGAVVVTPINLPAGNIQRVALVNTNLGVTWAASVKWPGGATPDLTTGTLRQAIVVLEAVGANFLASAAVY